MLFSISELQGFGIEATDGSIGRVDDLLFDDQRWVIRYLVIDTGKWLPGRRVLISPISVDAIDKPRGRVSLHLDKDRIRNSPDIHTDAPVSRQKETEFYTYYGYGPYWAGPGMWGPAVAARELRPVPGTAWSARGLESPEGDEGDPHLRSTREVSGYHIAAADGKIGHVEDFILDDLEWVVRHIVVDTSNWPGGRTVVMPPRWIHTIDWIRREVQANVTVDQIKSASEYRAAELLR
jgi:sporulation protein YlmC with PRC-barrel domain